MANNISLSPSGVYQGVDLFDDVPESAHLPLATAVSATLTPGTQPHQSVK